jgi:hypothetical protein
MDKFRDMAERIKNYPWIIPQCAIELGVTHEPSDQAVTIEDCLKRAIDIYARDINGDTGMDSNDRLDVLSVHMSSSLKEK